MAFRSGGLICIFLLVSTSSISTSNNSCPVSRTHFRLQFDGCYRPPRDPGFPTVSHHRIAVCAACIGKVHVCECGDVRENSVNGNERSHEFEVTPLSVGAKKIPISIETTSQHAEYEGLLIGLEWLIEYFSDQEKNEKDLFGDDIIDDDISYGEEVRLQQDKHKTRVLVTIEGDCKTVIDQLSGRSVPRKLESLHQRAKLLIDKLYSMHITTDVSNRQSNVDSYFDVEYQHIPRSRNSISDGLCNNLMSIISAKSWIDNIHKLEKFEKEISEQRLSSSQTPTKSFSLSKIFENVTRTTKHSLRPPLYEIFANFAAETKNYELLVEIGERLVEEEAHRNANTKARQRRGNQSCKNSIGSPVSTLLKRAGIKYQIRGWEAMGNQKRAKFLKRKYRVLLTNDGKNGSIADKDGVSILFERPEIHDGREVHASRSKTLGSRIASDYVLQELGDVNEGQWSEPIPEVWKPILDAWFVSARYKRLNEIIDEKQSAVWVVKE